jgi:hypothetical protein
MKTKTLATDEQGKLKRMRKHLAAEIGEAYAGLYSGMEQLRRRHYHRLGELFIQLRMTFSRGRKGDNEFGAFCNKEFSAIPKMQRNEYISYRKRLGPVTASAESDLPPLRRTAKPHLHDPGQVGARAYKRIVDEEVEEPTRFEVELENETAVVRELAEKIISAGFRVLSVKMHPDKDGGSNLGMRRLNQAKKLLQDALIRAIARAI